MLTINLRQHRQSVSAKQKGVVLLITLIMLVAMTLAAIALMRSVDTTNLVAGNLAFQQTSYHVGDIGTEQAIAYLYTVPNIQCDNTNPANPCALGYKSFHEPLLEPPTAGTTWDSFWNSMANNPNVGSVALSNPPAGYTGAFVIEALCASPMQLNCTIASTTTTTTTPQGQDMGSTTISFQNQVVNTNVHYYRITTRVEGPRNSVGYIQTMIAL